MDGDTPAPPELQLSWNCEKYSCLPAAGGYLDQDYSLMLHMAVLSNCYNAYNQYLNAQGAQIHGLSENTRRILRYLKDAGILFKA